MPEHSTWAFQHGIYKAYYIKVLYSRIFATKLKQTEFLLPEKNPQICQD